MATLLLAATLVLLVAALYLAHDIFIILSLAVLFAIFLTKSSVRLARLTGCNYELSLSIIVLCMIAMGLGSAWLLGSRVRAEIVDATKHADEANAELRRRLQDYPAVTTLLQQTPVLRDWVQPILENATAGQRRAGNVPASKSDAASVSSTGEDDSDAHPIGQTPTVSGRQVSQAASVVRSVADDLFSAIANALRTTLGLLLNSLIIVFVGLFLAIAPESSRDGVASFAPETERSEWVRVLNCMADSLWRWLIGRFASMLVTGVGVGVALAILGVPMAATLGVITGVLTFIPNIGAAIALMLAVFMSVPSGIVTICWVIVIYLAFQLLESYAVTPLIQQYQVSVPPALLISAQAVLGVLLGFLGAMVASPIVVVGIVLKAEVYDKHFLRSGEDGGD